METNISAQEFIDIPDNWNDTEIAQWFTQRMREEKGFKEILE